jgi:hypothetical protein
VNAPVEVLMVLAKDKSKNVRQYVAENVNTSVEVLVCVVEASRDDVFIALAPGTAEDVLASLVKSKKGEVRAALATRPYEPALPVLAQDKVVTVRVAVAKQPRTPLDVLKVLAADADVKVRKAVHANRSATDEIKAVAALIGVK